MLRTAAGRREVRDLVALLADLEDDWAAVVGPQRYARFREVLDELADELSAPAAADSSPSPSPSPSLSPSLSPSSSPPLSPPSSHAR